MRGVLRGHVAIGMMTSCPPDVITGTLAAFHDDHPGVAVTLIEAQSAGLLARVREGAIDLAVVGFASPPGGGGIHVEIINDDVLVAAVEHRHTAAARKNISLRALVDHDLICLPRGAGIRAGLDEGCAVARLQCRVALEASNPEVVASRNRARHALAKPTLLERAQR